MIQTHAWIQEMSSHLATPFPGIPPHHATLAQPLMILPSTSSPCTSRFTTFGIPFPGENRSVILFMMHEECTH